MRWSNWRTGSSPALESWPGDGSMTNGVPKNSRTCGQTPGTLISCLSVCRTGLAAQPLRRPRTTRVPQPTGDDGRKRLRRAHEPAGVPMRDVTQILSAIEQGDPAAAEQLL